MNIKHFIVIALVLLSFTAFGQDPVRDHDITYMDYFTQSFVQSMALSPDGENVAYIEWRWDVPNNRRNRDLWVVNVATKAMRRLTFDPANEVNPVWSPNGESIYFIGHFSVAGSENPTQDGSAQVWRIRKDGSDLQAITSIPGGVDDFSLSADGATLYYVIGREHVIDEWRDLRMEFRNDLEYGHGIHTVSEVWKMDLETWHTEKLVDNERYITGFDVTSDEQRIAMITNPSEVSMTHEGWSEVEVYDTATGELSMLENDQWREQAQSPYGWLGNPTWSSDGNQLAFSIDFDGYPAEIFVAGFSSDGTVDNIVKLRRPEDVSVTGGLSWHPSDGNLCFLGEHHARLRVYGVTPGSNESRTYTPGDVVIHSYNFTGSRNDMITLQSGLTYHRDIFHHRRNRDPERITNTNPQIDTWKLPQISIVEWIGAEGDVVEGILELPPDYDGEGPLPLMVNLHGGPTASELYAFWFWIYGRTAFAARGYAVLCPNYRGSTGFGDEFLTDLIGHENDRDVEDILTGVDYLIAEGIADPENMAVMGWSNGGFLTNCLISTNRFRAASTGAGTFDMTVQWGEEDTPGHVINYMEGLPWERPDEYREASPVYGLHDGIETAVLIHAGMGDPRVPVSHSRALHRALYRYLDVPCELVMYPGAGHSPTSYRHRLAKMKWDHAWFDEYMR